MTTSGRKPLAVALLALSGAALAAAALRPPRGLCDPSVGSHAALALAACLMLGALILLERAGWRRAALGGVAAAWGVVAASALLLLASAGRAVSATGMDAAYAAGSGAALALLLAGLAGRLAPATERVAARVASGCIIAAAAGAVAAWLVNARAADKTWASWSRVNDAAALVEEAVTRKIAPERDGTLAEALRELPRDMKRGVSATDAWGGDLRYSYDGKSWRVASLGSDRAKGPRSSGACPDHADDLAIADGAPVAWPESPCDDAAEAPAPSGPTLLDLRKRRP